MVNELKSLEEFREETRSYPLTEGIKRWKSTGKKVIGWPCIYIPEEIIDAAGALPVRIIGSCKELPMDDASARLSASCCSYPRTILQLAMDKQLDFLDGIVFAATCDSMRRLADAWEKYVPTIPAIHTLVVPRKSTEWAEQLFKAEVLTLTQKLEQFLGTTVSEDALKESVAVYNKGRKLVERLYELRKSNTPPISGTEVFEVLDAGCGMSRHDFNAMLERLLVELETGGRKLESDARLMVTGSVLNTPGFIRGIEKLGALVVVDELCSGLRHWSDLVETDNGRPTLENIGHRYLNRFPCPRQFPMSWRLDRVIQLAKEYRVDGIVSQIIRYCTIQVFDQPVLRERAEGESIPVLELEKEYGTPETGGMSTRVQAFLEVVKGKKAQSAKGARG